MKKEFDDTDLFQDYDDSDYAYQQYLLQNEEQKINEELKPKKMEVLLVSGDTLQKWNVDQILFNDEKNSTKNQIEKLELREIFKKREDYYFIHRTELLEKTHQL